MKCRGLIGNLTDSMLGVYAQTINGEVRKEGGGNHSADLRVCCADNAQLDALLDGDDWSGVIDLLIDHGRGLSLAGADRLVICGGALNPVVAEVGRALGQPVIDMGFAIATKLRSHGHSRVFVVGAPKIATH